MKRNSMQRRGGGGGGGEGEGDFIITNDRQTDRNIYLESYTKDSTSTTISKQVKITNSCNASARHGRLRQVEVPA